MRDRGFVAGAVAEKQMTELSSQIERLKGAGDVIIKSLEKEVENRNYTEY